MAHKLWVFRLQHIKYTIITSHIQDILFIEHFTFVLTAFVKTLIKHHKLIKGIKTFAHFLKGYIEVNGGLMWETDVVNNSKMLMTGPSHCHQHYNSAIKI